MLMVVAFMAISCQLDIEKTTLFEESEFVAPLLQAMSDVVVDKDNVKRESVVFNWIQAEFGVKTQVEYTVFLKKGEKVARLASSFSNTVSVTKQDLNGVVCNELGVDKNTKANVEAYLTAKVYGTDVKELKSEAIAFNVTTFATPLRWLFMPGNYQGWDIANAPQIWETDGGTNIYTTLVDLSIDPAHADYPNSFFKITVAQNWSDANWGYNFLKPSWTMPEQGDSNLSVNLEETKACFITVNRGKMTISKQNVSKVALIGSFDECGWDEGKELDLVYDKTKNLWTSQVINFTGDNKGFLVRLNKSWDYKYGTVNEPSGSVENGIKLVKGGADINVPESGSYIMRLYGNMTPLVLVMEKQ